MSQPCVQSLPSVRGADTEPCTGSQGQGTVTDIYFNAGIYTPNSSLWDSKQWAAFALQAIHFSAASFLQERNFHFIQTTVTVALTREILQVLSMD